MLLMAFNAIEGKRLSEGGRMSSEIDYRRIGRHSCCATTTELKTEGCCRIAWRFGQDIQQHGARGAGTESVQDYPALSATQTETGLCPG